MTARRAGLALLTVAAVAAAVWGATAVGGSSPRTSEATVLAAASLTEVLPQVDSDVRASFGGSNQLAQQVRQGFPFDVYLSASPRYAQALRAEGLVQAPVAFATNSLVLIVPRSNPAGIRSVRELAGRRALRLVAAAPDVPVGHYTREALERLDLLSVLDRVVSREPDVKGIVGKVALGEADAGFVYATDVAPVASRVTVIRLPRSAQPDVAYEAAIAADPRDADAAQAFMDALLGPPGRQALLDAGFGLPS